MKFLIPVALILFLSGCGVTYPEEKLLESIDSILSVEYSIEDVRTAREGGSLWLHVPVKRIFNRELELHEDLMKKLRNVSLTATRVFLSSDADIEFFCIYIFSEDGMELRMIRNTEDVEKARMWYISQKSLQLRSKTSIDYNPVVLGKKAIKSMAGAEAGDIRNSLKDESRDDIIRDIPEFEEIERLKARRIDDDKALIYAEVNPGGKRLLFRADSEFSEVFKNIMFLFHASAGEEDEDGPAEPDASFLEELSLPVISGVWDLEEGMPYELADTEDPREWDDGDVYSRNIQFKEFVAGQIERKIRARFAENMQKWDMALEHLEVYYIEQKINVIRRLDAGDNPFYQADPDYEIALASARAVRNYEMDAEKLIIHDDMWNIVKEISVEELLQMRPKRWRRIRRPDELSVTDIVLSMFIPGYGVQPQEEEEAEETQK